MADEHYTPAQASRVLARTGRPVSERRIRQLLQAGELEGEQSESGRWQIPRRAVHALMEESPRSKQGRERSNPKKRESPEASGSEGVRELLQRVEELSYRLGASESRLELTERAESTAREERDRLRAELEAERAERQRLTKILEDKREKEQPWWKRLLGG